MKTFLIVLFALAFSCDSTLAPAPQAPQAPAPLWQLDEGFSKEEACDPCNMGECCGEIAPGVFICGPCPDPPPGA